MKIKNPSRHLPHYAVRVHLYDGTMFNKRGSSQPEIDIPVEEGDFKALILECLTDARVAKIKLLLVDGKWIDYSEAALAELLADKPKPAAQQGCWSPPEGKRKPTKRKPVERKPVERKFPKPKTE